IKTLNPNGGYHVNAPGRAANTKVAVDAQLVGDTDRRYVAVGCRLQSDDKSFYEFYIYPASGSFGVQRVGENSQVLVRDTSKDVKPGTSSNHLELTCAGNALAATVNGALVASVTDTTYAEGRATISAGAYSDHTADSRFTNLTVTQQ
ncbi:MAG TPA: hypothetical protein VF157_09475, partial [Chloroflexota bacterium]